MQSLAQRMKFMHSPLSLSAFNRIETRILCLNSNTCRDVSQWVVNFLRHNSRGKIEGFGAIGSMLTKAARIHQVYDLLAVTLRSDKLSQTAIHSAALTQRVCIDCCTL